MAKKAAPRTMEKQRATKHPRKKVEEALANPNPIAGLDYADWQFAMQLALGKTGNASARIAYPNWSEETVRANAYAYANRPDIIRAKQHLLEVFIEGKEDTVIATKAEVAAFLTGVIRTPLSEIDSASLFCLEHTKTINSAGASEKFKKISPIDAIDKLGKIMGWLSDDDGKPKVNISVYQLIQQASSQGVPTEVTDIGGELLEDID